MEQVKITRSDGTEVFVDPVEVFGPEPTPEELAQKARQDMPAVTRMQFAIALAVQGGITAQEAKDFAGGNALPAVATDAIAVSGLSDTEKMAAEIRALGAPTIHRLNPLVLLMQQAVPMTDEQADALFLAAAAID
jgi:hypothetical protein